MPLAGLRSSIGGQTLPVPSFDVLGNILKIKTKVTIFINKE
jgi:hypothetical protein